MEILVRLCIDLSRHCNLYFKLHHTKLEDIRSVLARVTESCWFTAFDMEAMYHQIRLHDSVTDIFGFTVPNNSGGFDYFKYCHLPFGVSTAVHLVTKLMNPIKEFLHLLSLDISIYIDNSVHIARIFFRALIGIRFIIFVCRFAGWRIQWSKCQLVPSNSIQYLGYILNSSDMTIKLPESKLEKIYLLYRSTSRIICKSSASGCQILCSVLREDGPLHSVSWNLHKFLYKINTYQFRTMHCRKRLGRRIGVK